MKAGRKKMSFPFSTSVKPLAKHRFVPNAHSEARKEEIPATASLFDGKGAWREANSQEAGKSLWG